MTGMPILGPYQDLRPVYDHQLSGILGGVLENDYALIPSRDFRSSVDTAFLATLQESYVKRLPEYFREGEVLEQELARRMLNDFLEDTYLETDNAQRIVMGLADTWGNMVRTTELCLATILMRNWVEQGTLSEERKYLGRRAEKYLKLN